MSKAIKNEPEDANEGNKKTADEMQGGSQRFLRFPEVILFLNKMLHNKSVSQYQASGW